MIIILYCSLNLSKIVDFKTLPFKHWIRRWLISYSWESLSLLDSPSIWWHRRHNWYFISITDSASERCARMCEDILTKALNSMMTYTSLFWELLNLVDLYLWYDDIRYFIIFRIIDLNIIFAVLIHRFQEEEPVSVLFV